MLTKHLPREGERERERERNKMIQREKKSERKTKAGRYLTGRDEENGFKV